ncbi:DUF692 family multinuclear iron-containing protein [Pontibacillus salicampi]|uniref:DUF692 family multinuclear iron-containing protein n=1 Tax=Pontibacillus salicampi TaxID=1449801 RepID=A0ABV6LRC0_9BACI
MIKLACNYSTELMELIQLEQVIVDWIKLSRWDVYNQEVQHARPIRPVLLHTLPTAAQADLPELNWNRINEALQECKSPHIAIHLTGRHRFWPEQEPNRVQLKERLMKGISYCKEQLDVELLIENIPYYQNSDVYRTVTDPEFITELCEEADVGLLLDTAHARIAAWHRGESAYDYIDKLPLERVQEIHVCGPEYNEEEGLVDRHLEMSEQDYQLLAYTLEKTSPQFLTLEYGGTGSKMEWRTDKETIKRQLQRLVKLLDS